MPPADPPPVAHDAFSDTNLTVDGRDARTREMTTGRGGPIEITAGYAPAEEIVVEAGEPIEVAGAFRTVIGGTPSLVVLRVLRAYRNPKTGELGELPVGKGDVKAKLSRGDDSRSARFEGIIRPIERPGRYELRAITFDGKEERVVSRAILRVAE